MNIPLYRAKIITGSHKGKYIIGFLYSPTPTTHYILSERSGSLGLDNEIIIPENEYFEIDPNTLAISFQRTDNFTVFEAINENGLGGDIVEIKEVNYRGLNTGKFKTVTAVLSSEWEEFPDFVGNDNTSEIVKIKSIQDVEQNIY